MLAHFALAVERRGIEQDVGLDEHLGDAGEGLTARVADPGQRASTGANSVTTLADLLAISESPPAHRRKPSVNQLVEHLPQRVPLVRSAWLSLCHDRRAHAECQSAARPRTFIHIGRCGAEIECAGSFGARVRREGDGFVIRRHFCCPIFCALPAPRGTGLRPWVRCSRERSRAR